MGTLPALGAGPSANPIPAAGSYLWLKADAITGLTGGDPVATWPDSSGNSRDFTQGAGAAKPTWQTDQVNGLPALRFDGNDDVLEHTTKSVWRLLHDGSDFTLFVVFRTTDANPNDFSSLLGNNAASSVKIGFTLWYDDRSSATRNDRIHTLMTKGVSGQPVLNPGTDDDAFPAQTWGLIGALFDSGVGGDDFLIYVNGLPQVSQEPSNLPHAAGDAAHDMAVGNNGGTGFTKGQIAEILIYDSALSSTDRIQTEQYLTWRYSL